MRVDEIVIDGACARLEFSYSKEEILQHYVSHAPYGGNVVGVEAASWRYFNRPVDELSWAEYATLAVLPNSPSLIRPGKNSSILKKKRNNLLKKLLENDEIDSTTYSLSLLEELPTRPSSLPSHAKHLLAQIDKMGLGGSIVETTIDGSLQKTVSRKLDNYAKQLSANEIHNACALVVSLEDGSVKATLPDKADGDFKETKGEPLESCNLIGNPLTTSKPASLTETLAVPDVAKPIVLALDLNIPVSVSLSIA